MKIKDVGIPITKIHVDLSDYYPKRNQGPQIPQLPKAPQKLAIGGAVGPSLSDMRNSAAKPFAARQAPPVPAATTQPGYAPNPAMAKKGGCIKSEAQKLKRMGRDGDTELIHVNKAETRVLKALGGRGSINPETGLREYPPKSKTKLIHKQA